MDQELVLNETSKLASMPLWAKIALVAATGGLIVGGVFVVKAIKKHRANKVTVNEEPETHE